MTDDPAVNASSDDLVAELHQWHDRLTRLEAAWAQTAAQLRVVPPVTCPARREDALLALAHPDWLPNEAFQAGLDAIGLVDAAARHLSGLRTLLTECNLILTTWPPARAVVEHVAHAGWLLDPEITAEQRVARRWMAKLVDAHRHRRLTTALKAPNGRRQAARRNRDQIRDEVARRFPGINLDWDTGQHPHSPPWEIAGQRYPGLGEATRRFIDYDGMSGAHGLYDLLSLMAHPNRTAIASVLAPVERDGYIEYGYRLDHKEAVWPVDLAATFLYRAGMVVCSFFQLDDTALEASADSLPSAASRS
ncbi:hypothetical protein ACRAKI_22580 [Saccharothrix isguenensis]